jgi:prepilin-type N-terminal cleavage/methylation domain-containing protein
MDEMNQSSQNSRGFSLVELMIAMSLGLLVLGAAVTLFKKGLDLSVNLGERAEMQQNARAAVNAMVRDLTLAATDLPPGGIQLPTAAAPLQPRFGCIPGSCYLTNGSNIFVGNRLYYVNPHTQDGAQIGNITPDSLVVAYADSSMLLGTVTFSPAGDFTGSAITVTNPPAPAPGTVPITPGDLIWLSNTNGSAVGVVTAYDGVNTISFAAGDALNINQPPTQTGTVIANNINGNILSNLANTPIAAPPVIPGPIQAQRIFLVTYFVSQDPVTGRRLLQRQVNARAATPVAENVENLQVTYDTINAAVNPPVPVINQNNPAASPNLIRKINLALTIRTTKKVGGYGDYQRLTLATSVSPRNLSTTAIF